MEVIFDDFYTDVLLHLMQILYSDYHSYSVFSNCPYTESSIVGICWPVKRRQCCLMFIAIFVVSSKSVNIFWSRMCICFVEMSNLAG